LTEAKKKASALRSLVLFIKCANTKLSETKVRLRLKSYSGQLHRANHQPAKILTTRTSWLAQSFCGPPRNPPCCCFFLSHFLQKKQKRRLHSNRHHRAVLAPEKNNSKLCIHNM